MAMSELVAAVKAHAYSNYNKDGWDYLVECWSDSEIEEELGDGSMSVDRAIAKIGKILKIHDDQRKDAQAESW